LISQSRGLGDVYKRQRYGLVWLDVPEAFDAESESKIPTLRLSNELSIGSSSEKPPHILIEGDNYHALTCLNYTHQAKVDVIYIDPPYNTGSDGFRYKDKRVLEQYPDGELVPKDHPLRHSYWLSFMSKRLKLAKNLLKRSGVVFISINEDELAQLKLLCDEIFQPSNYLAMFTIKVRHEERILKGDKDFHEVVEYLLMYRASSEYKTIKKIRDNTSDDDYCYEVIELAPPSQQMTFGKKTVQVFAPGEFEVKKVTPTKSTLKKIQIRGTLREGNSSGRFYVANLEPLSNMPGYLFKVPDMGSDGLGYRYFSTPTKNKNGDYFQGIPTDREDTKEVPYPNYMDWENEFNTVGKEGGVDFGGGKKPIEFLKYYLQLGTRNKDAVILDFFGGSGSTGHAVIQMNHEDDGNRQAILVTLGTEIVKDKATHIMQDVLLQRMKNLKHEHEFGAKFFTTDFVGDNNVLAATDDDRIQLAKSANDLLALAESTLNQVISNDFFTVFVDEKKLNYTAIYFREELEKFAEFIDMVNAIDGATTVYQFSWGATSDFADEFTTPGVKVKVIPQPILEIYRRIFFQGVL
jgi:adenine-specific DNA-methyltransferase